MKKTVYLAFCLLALSGCELLDMTKTFDPWGEASKANCDRYGNDCKPLCTQYGNCDSGVFGQGAGGSAPARSCDLYGNCE